jgi:uncharacterized protein YqeY
MSIEQEIKDQMIAAMKAKDTVRLSVVRGIKAAFTNEVVAKGKTPQDSIDDDSAMAVIKKLAKQRKDSIKQFVEGGREDLADSERAELLILEEMLPEMMSQEQIKPIAEAKIAELGIDDKSKMGILIGAVMKETAGKADGNDVKAVIDSLL